MEKQFVTNMPKWKVLLVHNNVYCEFTKVTQLMPGKQDIAVFEWMKFHSLLHGKIDCKKDTKLQGFLKCYFETQVCTRYNKLVILCLGGRRVPPSNEHFIFLK